MRYKVKSFEIRSENAAKPCSQAAKAVIDWIRRKDRIKNALDLGCGKLRYTRHLAEKCEHLGLVDSMIQIERKQMIRKRQTTIKEYVAKYWPHAEVYCIEEFLEKTRRKYDFVLCANVISAIPSKRMRAKTLRSILMCLKKKGQVLVVNQYTNSYFKQVIRSIRATPHLDGYILSSARGSYYYGILPGEKMSKILLGCGFSIIESWRNGQSAFVLAGRK